MCLPLFWDQVDNAQRLDETGFGVRLAAYDADEAQLTGAIDRLLADRALAARLAALSARLQADPGTVRAADLIERLARHGRAGPGLIDRRGGTSAERPSPAGAQCPDDPMPARGACGDLPPGALQDRSAGGSSDVTDTLEKTRTYQQFIGGQWVDSASGQTLAVENPANGEVIAQVQASGPEDVDRAVKAAGEGLPDLAAHDPRRAQPRPAQAGRRDRGPGR